VSREIETVLDDIDLIPESYELQVSSPGTDRPIRTDDDVRRNSGRRVLVDTSAPVEGEVRFRGVLVGLESDSLRLRLDDGRVVALPRTLVAVARQDVDFDLHARREARRRQQ
jgi:ribosome maturation factor RimP